MEKVTLGRTGLSVTVAGLGCGGHSRLGLAKYGAEHASQVARAAYDAGVNFFDTATVYGTEEALCAGLTGIPRDRYVLSTKFPYADREGNVKSPEALMQTLEQSLKALRTDCIDLYHLHGVQDEHYDAARDILVPAMQKAQRQGKIRFIGVTEAFGPDTSHQMLKRALPENLFDVVMVGYNLLNPSAVNSVFPLTTQYNIGTLCMFAVRTALSNPEQLKVDIGRILNANQADPALVKTEGTLDFLIESGAANSVMEAAYRFCRHTKGMDVILTGTGSIDHLKDNLKAIEMPPLPDAILDRLHQMFGSVDCVSGQ